MFHTIENFYPSSVFHCYFKNAKCTVKRLNNVCDRPKWGKFGPSYLLIKQNDLFLMVFLDTDICRKQLRKVKKGKIR